MERLASFVAGTSHEDLGPEVRQDLKIRVLDALGCALGALGGETVGRVREYATAFGPAGPCTLVGGGCAPPGQAALVNGALVRYLDFNDSYLAPGETCHPSDNLAPVLAAAELADADGAALLAALAVAYQVQCRLSDEGAVRRHGFDHTTHLAYSAAAGAARALGLDAERTAHGIAISGTALNALRVTRTGALSNWKGLAAPFAASSAVRATLLAAHGLTGPLEVFEGNKGLFDAITGPFEIAWEAERPERVRRTIVKRYNAEIHSQSALEAALLLRREHGFRGGEVERVEVEVFDVAYRIIGGGEEGEKTRVRTKEEADHSLPYMLAVALLDGAVMPAQYEGERIARPDVQALLRRVVVRPDAAFSRRFPAEMPARVTIALADGRVLARELPDYAGFHTRPAGWAGAREKFMALGSGRAPASLLEEIAAAVAALEGIRVAELTALLGRAGAARPRTPLIHA
ncbi:MAG TPA: MmgE/PrpD family protein [Gemmatimonadaceae bacterium]|nr:MmgE/PrpD family protein [Gemmatimonadaceae bacterium]